MHADDFQTANPRNRVPALPLDPSATIYPPARSLPPLPPTACIHHRHLTRHHLPFPIVSPVAFDLPASFAFFHFLQPGTFKKTGKCLGQRCTGLWFRFVDIREHAKIKPKCVSYHHRIQLDHLELGKKKPSACAAAPSPVLSSGAACGGNYAQVAVADCIYFMKEEEMRLCCVETALATALAS
jgi:hypothetical protein